MDPELLERLAFLGHGGACLLSETRAPDDLEDWPSALGERGGRALLVSAALALVPLACTGAHVRRNDHPCLCGRIAASPDLESIQALCHAYATTADLGAEPNTLTALGLPGAAAMSFLTHGTPLLRVNAGEASAEDLLALVLGLQLAHEETLEGREVFAHMLLQALEALPEPENGRGVIEDALIDETLAAIQGGAT